MLPIQIRKAVFEDKKVLLDLINALADYEKLPRPDKEAQERLKKDLFNETSNVFALLANFEEKTVGYAIYLFTYSSFLAKSTLYIEDIFVLPEYRSKGIGKALLKHCAEIALQKDCGRMEWQVLDWNKLAIDFYEKIGARSLKDWVNYRLTKEDIEEFLRG